LLESKAIEALKQQQPEIKKSQKTKSKKDDLENFDINDLVNEIDNDDRFTDDGEKKQEEKKNNKEEEKEITDTESIEIAPIEEKDGSEEIQKTFDGSFTLKNFFQRKLYFENDLDSFCGSLSDEDIVNFLIELFTFSENYCQYPAIVKDNQSVYIDSTLFFISIGKNIKKDNEDDFLKKLFSSNRINMQNATFLLKSFNTILSNKISIEIFKIWKNQDGGEVCLMKRSFEYDNSSFTSLIIILDTKTLNSLKIDISNITKVELQDKIRGAKMLSRAIAEES